MPLPTSFAAWVHDGAAEEGGRSRCEKDTSRRTTTQALTMALASSSARRVPGSSLRSVLPVASVPSWPPYEGPYKDPKAHAWGCVNRVWQTLVEAL